MKLVVMSDSHGDTETIEAILERETDADAFFHCGDSEMASNDPILDDVHIVQGNCDWGGAFQESATVEVQDQTILMVHGHQHAVKKSLMQLKYTAHEIGADVVLFGHSHLYGAELQDDVLFVNPGSTTMPRGHRSATYAIIERDESLVVKFCDPLTGSIVEEANFTIS